MSEPDPPPPASTTQPSKHDNSSDDRNSIRDPGYFPFEYKFASYDAEKGLSNTVDLINLCYKYILSENTEALALIARDKGIPPYLRYRIWPLLLKKHPFVLHPYINPNFYEDDEDYEDNTENEHHSVERSTLASSGTNTNADKRNDSREHNLNKGNAQNLARESRTRRSNSAYDDRRVPIKQIRSDLKKYFRKNIKLPFNSSSQSNGKAGANGNEAPNQHLHSDPWYQLSSVERKIFKTLEYSIVKFLRKWGGIFRYEPGLAWIALGLAEWYPPLFNSRHYPEYSDCARYVLLGKDMSLGKLEKKYKEKVISTVISSTAPTAPTPKSAGSFEAAVDNGLPTVAVDNFSSASDDADSSSVSSSEIGKLYFNDPNLNETCCIIDLAQECNLLFDDFLVNNPEFENYKKAVKTLDDVISSKNKLSFPEIYERLVLVVLHAPEMSEEEMSEFEKSISQSTQEAKSSQDDGNSGTVSSSLPLDSTVSSSATSFKSASSNGESSPGSDHFSSASSSETVASGFDNPTDNRVKKSVAESIFSLPIKGGSIDERISFFLHLLRKQLPELSSFLKEEGVLTSNYNLVSNGDEWLIWWIKWGGAKALNKTDRGRLWDLVLGWRPYPGLSYCSSLSNKISSSTERQVEEADDRLISQSHGDIYWNAIALSDNKEFINIVTRLLSREAKLKDDAADSQRTEQLDISTLWSSLSKSKAIMEKKFPYCVLNPHIELLFIYLAFLKSQENLLFELDQAEIRQVLNNGLMASKTYHKFAKRKTAKNLKSHHKSYVTYNNENPAKECNSLPLLKNINTNVPPLSLSSPDAATLKSEVSPMRLILSPQPNQRQASNTEQLHLSKARSYSTSSVNGSNLALLQLPPPMPLTAGNVQSIGSSFSAPDQTSNSPVSSFSETATTTNTNVNSISPLIIPSTAEEAASAKNTIVGKSLSNGSDSQLQHAKDRTAALKDKRDKALPLVIDKNNDDIEDIIANSGIFWKDWLLQELKLDMKQKSETKDY